MNKPLFETISSAQHKTLEEVVAKIGLDQALVYLLYVVGEDKPKLAKDPLSTFLILEMFDRTDLVKYFKEKDEEEAEDLDYPV